jgi:predicted ATPase
LHERAGLALESIFAGQLDDHLGELARQYSHSDNRTKAIEYLGRAGQQALKRSAYADAISNLTAAIDLLQKLPDRSDRIQRELGLEVLKTLPDTPDRTARAVLADHPSRLRKKGSWTASD